MNIAALKSESIVIAAGAARGDALGKLLRKCENQKTISSAVIERELEDIHDRLKDYAYQMKKLIDII